jgi:hypothetical protein
MHKLYQMNMCLFFLMVVMVVSWLPIINIIIEVKDCTKISMRYRFVPKFTWDTCLWPSLPVVYQRTPVWPTTKPVHNIAGVVYINQSINQSICLYVNKSLQWNELKQKRNNFLTTLKKIEKKKMQDTSALYLVVLKTQVPCT